MLKSFGLCRWPGRIHGIGKMSYECYTRLLSVNFFSWNHILASSSADSLKVEITWAEGSTRKITCQVLGQTSCPLSIKVGKVILTQWEDLHYTFIPNFPLELPSSLPLSRSGPDIWKWCMTRESSPMYICKSINALSKANTICNYWCPDKAEYMTKGWGVSRNATLNFPVTI